MSAQTAIKVDVFCEGSRLEVRLLDFSGAQLPLSVTVTSLGAHGSAIISTKKDFPALIDLLLPECAQSSCLRVCLVAAARGIRSGAAFMVDEDGLRGWQSLNAVSKGLHESPAPGSPRSRSLSESAAPEGRILKLQDVTNIGGKKNAAHHVKYDKNVVQQGLMERKYTLATLKTSAMMMNMSARDTDALKKRHQEEVKGMRRRLADAEDIAEAALQQQRHLEEKIALLRGRADAHEARANELQQANAALMAQLHKLSSTPPPKPQPPTQSTTTPGTPIPSQSPAPQQSPSPAAPALLTAAPPAPAPPADSDCSDAPRQGSHDGALERENKWLREQLQVFAEAAHTTRMTLLMRQSQKRIASIRERLSAVAAPTSLKAEVDNIPQSPAPQNDESFSDELAAHFDNHAMSDNKTMIAQLRLENSALLEYVDHLIAKVLAVQL